MYLGNKLNKKASVKEEISHQMQQVTITWKRLHVYWKATNASKKWQLLAYDAIIKSKLLYGLETAQVSRADLKRIDAFQLRGIRQILGEKHTYWDREATNHILFDMASRIISETNKGKREPGSNIGRKRQHQSNDGGNTLLDDIEALRLLWIKEDTSWDTAAVLGEHRKKLRASV